MEHKKQHISRRTFIVRTLLGGTGILLGTAYVGRNHLRRVAYEMMENPDMLSYMGDTSHPLMWFEISTDNKITLHSPKVEMGQGTFTGLVQIAADELEIPLDTIRIVHAQTATGNIDSVSTGGSTSVAGLWQPLRELSATLREMLKIEGAKKLGVSVSEVSTINGSVTAKGQSLTYGEVVKDVQAWEIPETPTLKELAEYKYVGKPVARVDLTDKVFGAPMFGMDATMPDMLYGAVVRPEKIGAKYISADVSQASTMPGVVKVVVEKDFVGVVAKSYLEAENAKRKIKVQWQIAKEWTTEEIESAIEVGKGNDMVVQLAGDPESIFDAPENTEKLISAEFKSPLGAHAQLEPNGALAHVDGDKATVMISTQVVKVTRTEVASRLGLKEENVNIIPTYLGGGFGRRLHTPNAMQAALLSKAVGKPVKSFLTRKEEFKKDTFRPPTHHLLKAKLDEKGLIEAMEHHYASGDVMYNSPLIPGFVESLLGADVGAMRGGRIQYSKIPNIRAVSWHTDLPFATSWWRSLGLLANTFAIESFMDELAEKAGVDPITYRLSQIQNNEAGKRLRKVIEVARDKSKYRNKANGTRAMGFACSTDAGTSCAQVFEVSVLDGQIKIEKVTCVIDPGFAVNPDQVKAQCEGSIMMGISAAMFEKMTVKNSELRPVMYGPYKMALMRDAPREIDIEIINGTGKPGAVGEPPLGPVAAGIANAVYRITGKRLREMPFVSG